MSGIATPSSAPIARRKFDNGAEFLHSIGDVPMSRVIWNPLPGTATEQHLLELGDGAKKRLCELVDGTLVEKPLGYEESLIALRIGSAILTFVQPRKIHEYSASGSKLVWLVYPKTETVAVFDRPSKQPSQVLVEDQNVSGGPVLPGIAMNLTDIFNISDFE